MSKFRSVGGDSGQLINSWPVARTYLGLNRARFVAFMIFSAFTLIAPVFLYPVFLMKVYCFVIFGLAYNLLLGYTGMMSFGHAAFFGMGGYVCGWVATRYGMPVEVSVLAGTLFAAAMGAVFGWIAIRRAGLYFAMITLGLAQMVYFICLQAKFTGGEDGLQHIPRGSLLNFIDLNANMNLYWTMTIIVLGSILFVNRLVHSPFGSILRAIQNNPERTKSIGYAVDRYKLISFTLSAALTGFAASLKSVIFSIASLTDASMALSTEAVLIVLVGGIGTIFGPVLGAFIIISIEHVLSPYGPWVLMVQGTVFIAFVLYFRQGIVGQMQKHLNVKL